MFIIYRIYSCWLAAHRSIHLEWAFLARPFSFLELELDCYPMTQAAVLQDSRAKTTQLADNSPKLQLWPFTSFNWL